MSAAGGQKVAVLTVKTPESIRSAENFDLFWKSLLLKSSSLDISEPKLPRRRKTPRRYEKGEGESHFLMTIEEHYRRFYFEVLDLAINSIKQRFDQPGYRMYQHLESLLLQSANRKTSEEELEEVTSFYGTDIDKATLRVQLLTLSSNLKLKM